jgi:2-C-methyl-D-erythritol 4-phosphate cytidylyltransferase
MSYETLGVVVLAAGRGKRMGKPIPKAYLPLQGKPILYYCLERLCKSSLVSEIVVVVHPDDRSLLQSQITEAFPLRKELKVALGGEQRQDSSRAGVQATYSRWIAVHDGVRPFFSLQLLEAVFAAARVHRAVIPALPLRETVHSVDPEGFIVSQGSRQMLHLAQTPQCFERELLEHSLNEAHRQRRYFTDEAGAVLAMGGVRAKIVPGEPQNIKITTPWELKMAEALLEKGLAP